jgi:hypothetical protein
MTVSAFDVVEQRVDREVAAERVLLGVPKTLSSRMRRSSASSAIATAAVSSTGSTGSPPSRAETSRPR